MQRQAPDAFSDQVPLDPSCHSNIVVKSTTEITVLAQSLPGRAGRRRPGACQGLSEIDIAYTRSKGRRRFLEA